MISNTQIDGTDIKILRLLQQNAKLTTKQLAEQVNLSPTPVFERLKRLESEGYIKKYVAILDADKLGRSFMVFTSVKLKQMTKKVAEEFVRVIRDIPEVTACYNVAGEFDYILVINAPSMSYYNDFVINVLGTVESIGSILSTFVMKEIKQSNGIYI
ncbi:MAG: Lrp/AsnC family transcriptional regulator [Bacteroidales bacterium]|nr:Lrp/AsnC family transcriptional regulator [Candidatus Cryptobacteroides choladohippi]MCQ2178764.1 Lrp/AsnC family transcriptional regulator [Bacteroidales bacterium]